MAAKARLPCREEAKDMIRPFSAEITRRLARGRRPTAVEAGVARQSCERRLSMDLIVGET